MRALAAIALLLTAAPAWSETAYPALHDVTDVNANDVLNIREAPDASAPIVGVLAPDAVGVEVIAADSSGRWGLLNVDEGTGWVSLRYLLARPGQTWDSFPDIAVCFGTEPFWSLTASALSTPMEEVSGQITARLTPVQRRDRFGLLAEFGGAPLQAVLTRQQCSDGMSDRAFGVEINAFWQGEMLSGCCSLAN